MFIINLQITVEHPAAKSMIEIARTQDEEVGDGTTSVIVLGNKIVKLFNTVLKIVKLFNTVLKIVKLFNTVLW